MNFEQFWKALQDELKQEKTFSTLRQNKKFRVSLGHVKGNPVVLVTPESSMIQRSRVPRNEFEGIWNNVKKYAPETRFVNKQRRLESFTNKNQNKSTSNNLSYILRLIQHLVKDQPME